MIFVKFAKKFRLIFFETKLDDSFPDSQFEINGHQFPFPRKYRDNKGGGKIVFLKQGLIINRLKQLETKISETIF